MAKLPPFPGTTGKRAWRTAFDALRKLLADGDDTTQVFRIMRSLNVGDTANGYARLIATSDGGRIAYERVELAQRFSDRTWVDGFAPGTVGAAYREFLAATGYSADGLVEVSRLDPDETDVVHPYAWMGRRTRDVHDIWHVLTGYKADETMGEACLVAFSYAQTRGLGWAFIAGGAALKSLRATGGTLFARAVREGYRNGRRAAWLLGEDYEALMHEPIDAARARLRIAEPVAYRQAQTVLGATLASYASAQKERAQAALA
ncbi:ubiquinone biosynthesis protein COQ4 [Sphingomonadaceae bacterium OTU29MARTA1]|uniref:ubiquinone biosynthesis protein COQ4 n=1 Tax=Sphingomonas sp. Leaf37 TaxID=2876552 RepID=UPI001E2A6457|nr:ubiquinone biosynthesis protein COQ4 [Sphingomonas sp. Leaf37]USU08240.1 ubiquinone biosynthesis protein COQ4 [Sphingomonadaceae bacterium OTU29MARTA1]